MGSEIAFKQATIDKITHEMAVLMRLKFAAKSGAFSAEQKSLLEETIDADLAALQAELDKIRPDAPSKSEKQQPKREKLPSHLTAGGRAPPGQKTRWPASRFRCPGAVP